MSKCCRKSKSTSPCSTSRRRKEPRQLKKGWGGQSWAWTCKRNSGRVRRERKAFLSVHKPRSRRRRRWKDWKWVRGLTGRTWGNQRKNSFPSPTKLSNVQNQLKEGFPSKLATNTSNPSSRNAPNLSVSAHRERIVNREKTVNRENRENRLWAKWVLNSFRKK
jgi:hypothetical protein